MRLRCSVRGSSTVGSRNTIGSGALDQGFPKAKNAKLQAILITALTQNSKSLFIGDASASRLRAPKEVHFFWV